MDLATKEELRIVREQLANLGKKKKLFAVERQEFEKNSPCSETNKDWYSKSDYKRSALRYEARCLHLAANFLRGTPYRKVEKKSQGLDSRPSRKTLCFYISRHVSYFNVMLEEAALLKWMEEEL